MPVRFILLAWVCMIACAVSKADGSRNRTDSLEGQVGLNHFYVVLDEATFAAVRDSGFVRTELAAVDSGLPDFTPPRADSQRLYVRGKTTYMEFLGPRNPFNEPVGKVGIALGVDELELLENVQSVWQAQLGGGAERHAVKWKKATPPVPWYDVVQHRSTIDNPHLVLWASAYRPEFLPWLYPQRSALDNRGSRADFLAPQFRPERLLRDVTGLTIALPAQLRDQVSRQLEAVGFRRLLQGEVLELRNAGCTLTLLAADAKRKGLIAIEIATNRDRTGDVGLGAGSTIELGTKRSALWYFNGQPSRSERGRL